MDLGKFISKESKDALDVVLDEVFKNEHIRVIETNNGYEVMCYDIKGLRAMHECFEFSLAIGDTIANIEELEEFYAQSVKDNQEGVMIKVLDKEYRAGKRVGYMYKIKPTLEDIDVVIVGALRGVGKRGGYFSSFIVAVQDDSESLVFKTIGKVGSGFSEDEEDELSIQCMTALLEPLIESVDEKLGITYFKPEIIIQVSFQNVQESQTTQSKYALRFPKIVCLRTNDKTLKDVTTLSEVLSSQ